MADADSDSDAGLGGVPSFLVVVPRPSVRLSIRQIRSVGRSGGRILSRLPSPSHSPSPSISLVLRPLRPSAFALAHRATHWYCLVGQSYHIASPGLVEFDVVTVPAPGPCPVHVLCTVLYPAFRYLLLSLNPLLLTPVAPVAHVAPLAPGLAPPSSSFLHACCHDRDDRKKERSTWTIPLLSIPI